MAADKRTLEEMLAQKAGIAKLQDARQRELVRAWARAWDEINADMLRTIELMMREAESGTPLVSRARRLRHQRQALKVVSDKLQQVLRASNVVATADAERLIRQAGSDTWRLLQAQLPTAKEPDALMRVQLTRADVGQIDQIVTRTTEQITARHVALNREAERAMKRELSRALAVGDNPREAARRMVAAVKGQFDGGLVRANVIARTEQISAYRAAALEHRKANADVLSGWRWTATKSARSCGACIGMDGTIHKVDEPGPQGHHQCLLPGAIIAGPPPSAATARWYEGEACDIKTAAGRDLSVTPNHPILTARGWIPAGLLREGDHLVSSSGAERVAIGAGPDDEQVPPLIENVVEALLGSPSVLAVGMPTAAEDFHGDGAGSQVHVVATNGLLGYALDPTFGDPSSELQLFSGRMSEELLAGAGDVRDVLVGVGAALDGSVSRCNQCGVLFSTATGDHLPVGRGVVSKGHASHRESLADEGPGDSEALGDFILRLSADVPGDDVLAVDALKECLADVLRLEGASLLGGSPETLRLEDGSEASLAYPIPSAADLAAHAGQVVTDRVVDIGRRSWQGHVYNLQTETGWYLANSIVVHNCRCTAMPITKSWEELGFSDIEEPRASDVETGPEWFARQSEDVQRQIVGTERLKLIQQGRITVADIPGRRKNPGWRDSINMKSVDQLR